MRILHIIPKSAVDVELYHHGSTKDIQCRREYFKRRGIDTLELPVSKQEQLIISCLENIAVETFDVVLVDIPRSFREIFQYLRRRAPQTKLIFRSHNAEFFHRLDWMIVSSGLRNKLACARRAFEGLINDIRTLKVIDSVAPIGEWDAQYWRWLGKREKVVTVPFYDVTDSGSKLEEVPKGGSLDKENLCVCVTAVQQNPLIIDAARNFSELVRNLNMRLPQWKFAITGNTDGMEFLVPRIERLGRVASIESVLSKARAVAILSDYGRGFKTKIMDALKAFAYVLVTPRLHRRLPDEVKRFCFSVNPSSVEEFASALQRCTEPYPTYDVNSVFRAQAYEALDKVLGVK
jgi:hypothetical protein